jgi:hypothetical protein
MLAVEITNHVELALARLLTQYQDQPNFAALLTVLVQEIQNIESQALYPLDAARQIFNAVGQQLDYLGTIVGISRNGLSDAEYLLFIYGTIASNNSDSTIPSVLNIIINLFQAQVLLLQEIYPAGISVQVIGTALDPSLYPVAIELVKNALGAGIDLIFIGGTANTNVFRFDGMGVNPLKSGFGDLNDPTIGGGFVGLILT